ncbi:vegetative cell wall protein gp1-like [Sorghum bicolor]|uniref:vegetative cell wall protein gp1-like n=1 Tax=Sorghum bicolor TaxID=4558 RepID=UPI000B4258BF|nr:vegetative cell wall protein gp1-like [Sorghum bicolor]|eukprot:XP_021309290.1 vegetative cell wall protein gp1-like [Sorghum bicolor]
MEKRSDQGKTPAEAEVDHVVANKEEEEEATELKKDKTRKTKMVRLTQVQIDYCIAVHNANNKPMAATKKGVPKFTEVLSPAQLAEERKDIIHQYRTKGFAEVEMEVDEDYQHEEQIRLHHYRKILLCREPNSLPRAMEKALGKDGPLPRASPHPSPTPDPLARPSPSTPPPSPFPRRRRRPPQTKPRRRPSPSSPRPHAPAAAPRRPHPLTAHGAPAHATRPTPPPAVAPQPSAAPAPTGPLAPTGTGPLAPVAAPPPPRAAALPRRALSAGEPRPRLPAPTPSRTFRGDSEHLDTASPRHCTDSSLRR